MRVFDCFTYFDEIELLKLRIEELKDVVDCFVIVEGHETFTGKPKDSSYQIIYEQCTPNDKIDYHQVAFPDDDMTPWEREVFQRNCLWKEGCFAPDDILIFSDVDEIPNPVWIQTLQESPDIYMGPHQLEVTQYFWDYHWQVPDHCNRGARPVVTRAKDVTTPQEMRASSDLPRIEEGGWHFSFFGHASDGRFNGKVEAFSHTEMDVDIFKDPELIQQRARLGIDPFDRFPLKYTPIGESHPKTLQYRTNV